MRLSAAVILLCSPLFLEGTKPETWCEAKPEIRRELKRLDPLRSLPRRQQFDGQRKIVEELLAKYPNDLFLHLQYQHVSGGIGLSDRKPLTSRYKALAESHPSDPTNQFLYAEVLLDFDTPQSMSIAQRLADTDPSFTRAHLLLADIYGWGKFKDNSKAQQHLASFFAACPESLDSAALETAQHYADANLAAKIVPPLKKRLSDEKDPDQLQQWAPVWNLEFKARPIGEHQQLRSEITQQLTRLRTANSKPDAAWLMFLKEGYTIAGNKAAATEQETKLAQLFPQSQQAMRVSNAVWVRRASMARRR